MLEQMGGSTCYASLGCATVFETVADRLHRTWARVTFDPRPMFFVRS